LYKSIYQHGHAEYFKNALFRYTLRIFYHFFTRILWPINFT